MIERSPLESSSSGRQHFQWIMRKGSIKEQRDLPFFSDDEAPSPSPALPPCATSSTRRAPLSSFFRFCSLLSSLVARRDRPLTGTIYGRRRGRVRLAFQGSPCVPPAVLVELPAQTSALVREMSSGLVRIALECDRPSAAGAATARLVEERMWRAYCNGRKCGYAVRRECGVKDWKVFRAIEMVTMGAGVLPEEEGGSGGGGEREVEAEMMYVRAQFERVVGSKDSEAFYMMNPEGKGAELSVYFLRV